MRKTVMVILAILMVAGAWSSASAWTLNFENGSGQNDQNVASGIAGVTFKAADGIHDWIYCDAPSATGTQWNFRNQLGDVYNGGYYWMYDYVAVSCGIDADAKGGRIDFDNQDGSFFSTGYSSASNFYLEAYDKDGNLLDTDQGGPNLYYSGAGDNFTGPMGQLTVSSASNNIAYVIMHDTGNFWICDNMSGDASGVKDQGAVPEPATLLLFGLGLVGGAIRRRMSK